MMSVMAPARRRRSSPLARLSRPGLAAGALGLGLLLLLAFVGIAVQRNAVARDIAGLTLDIAQEQARNAALQASVAEKATSAYVSDKARELGYVKPGEAIIALDNPQRTPAPPPEPIEHGRLNRWLMLFFGAR